MANKYFMTVKCRNEELDKKVTAQAEQVIKNLLEGEDKPFGIEMVKTEDGFTMAFDDTSVVYPTVYLKHDSIHTESEFNKANNFEITIKCISNDQATRVGEAIHKNIKGMQEYIDSKVLLNYNSDEVVLAIGAECDCYPFFSYNNFSIVPKDSKYEVYVRCKNKDLKDMVIGQVLQQMNVDNRNKNVKAAMHLLTGEPNFEFFIKDTSENMPVIMYGYKEDLATEIEFDKANNFEIEIVCKNKSIAAKIGEFIHNQLCGLKDYVDSKILLNCDTEDILVCFGAESNYYPIFLFVQED